jgi:hypothetical protein
MNNQRRQTRQFEMAPAIRHKVPLFIGLFGASGSGKTMSALRVARGIQRVCPGEIVVVDTENGRAEHYAEMFDFQRIDFQPPFGSLDYRDVIDFAASKKPSVIVLDSMTHEHSGLGGMLDYQEKEVARMASNDNGQIDYAKAERVKMLAWQKPKAARRELLDYLVRLNTNIILCFRAKETSKPVKKGNKTEVESLGFMPIGGDEFVFEMDMSCFLPPNSRGFPQWKSENPGERMMMKLPAQFEGIFASDEVQLNEDIGVKLAQWAAGDTRKAEPKPQATPERDPLSSIRADGLAALRVLSDEMQAEAVKAMKAEIGLAGISRMNAEQVAQAKGIIARIMKVNEPDTQVAESLLDGLDDAFADDEDEREPSDEELAGAIA